MAGLHVLVATYGYLAIFVVLLLDGLGVPLPTELTLIFSGYLIHAGTLHMAPAWGAAWAGSLTGAGFAYAIGRHFGPSATDRISRLLHLTPEHLERASTWFQTKGALAVLVARFVPVVRNLISYPAGIMKMPVVRYSVFSALGYGLWEFASIFGGFYLGKAWKKLLSRMELATWFGLGAIALGALIFFLYRRLNRPPRQSAS